MPNIFIPFAQGQHEETDAHLLPQGLFKSITDGRLTKDGRLVTRNAYVQDAAATGVFLSADVLAAGQYDTKHSLIFRARLGDDVPPSPVQHTFSTYIVPTFNNQSSSKERQTTGSIGVPTLLPSIMGTALVPTTADIAASDSVIVGGKMYVAVTAYDNVTKASITQVGWFGFASFLYEIDPQTGRVLRYTLVALNASNIKIMDMGGGTLGLFYASGNDIRYTPLSTAFLSGSGEVVLVTASPGRAPYFDVAPGLSGGNPLLVYEDTTTTIKFGSVNAAGVFSLINTLAGLTGPELRTGICASGTTPATRIVLVVIDGATFSTGTFKYAIYDTGTGTFTTALTVPTWAYGTPVGRGYPVVAASSLDDWTAAWNAIVNTGFNTADVMVQTTAGSTLRSVQNLYVASKPFTLTNNFIGVLAQTQDSVGLFSGTYYIVDNDTLSAESPMCEATIASALARPADVAAVFVDPRRRWVNTAVIGVEPGISALIAAVPTRTDIKGGNMGVVRVEYGRYEEMFQTARLNQQLFISGARILEYDGAKLFDVGLSTPVINSSVVAVGGSIANGTYSFVAVYETLDALGYRHESAPSLPTIVTLSGANTKVTLTVSPLSPTWRNTPQEFTSRTEIVRLRIYRTTLNQPSVFQDAGGVVSTVAGSFTFGFTVACTDNDAAVAVRQELYTQGGAGGESGNLQNDIPPPARYISAGSDRVWIAHTDDPTQYQASKLRTDGEPINWSNTAPFRGRVDTPITALALMDGAAFVFTHESVWVVNGVGPDDNGAGGSFDSPVRLPAEVGCISAASLLLTGEGLFFQGAPGRMYKMPRGGGTPEWIGQPIRDTLAAFPYITSSAFNEAAGLCYWSICDTTATNGRLLVYDVRNKQWYVDNFLNRVVRSLSIFNDLLVIDGSIIETPGNYNDSDGTNTAAVFAGWETGDIRPFGATGTGRIRKAQVFADMANANANLTLQLKVSYNSGLTYSETATWVPQPQLFVTDEPLVLDHLLIRPRTDSVRLKGIQTSAGVPNDGFRFYAIGLEAFPETGLKRNRAGARA